MKTKPTTHVALVLDDSGSMSHLLRRMHRLVNKQIETFREDEKRTKQNIRLSIYTFGSVVKRVCFDRKLTEVPEVDMYLHAGQGATAMIGGTTQAIEDMKGIDLGPEDAVLVSVFTDGLENVSPSGGPALKRLISKLSDDFTIGASVPSLEARNAAISYGIPDDNVQIWETTEVGIEKVAATTKMAYSGYMTQRSMGVKSTKALFKVNDVTKGEVKKKLEEVDAADYETHIVRPYYDGYAIKNFVEEVTGRPYRVGSAYYQVTKAEKVQGGKVIAVVEKATGKMFSGVNARKVLGLPNYEVKIAPAQLASHDLFVQSTSTNRKLVGDTHVVVFK